MKSTDNPVKQYRPISKGKRQVFIVEDDESVRRSLKILMLTYGYIVKTFSCAEEFFSAIPNDSPGCLILDIHLPGLRGLEVYRRMVKSGSRRPVIMITGDKSDALKERSIKSGVAGYFQKPVNARELVTLITQVSTN